MVDLVFKRRYLYLTVIALLFVLLLFHNKKSHEETHISRVDLCWMALPKYSHLTPVKPIVNANVLAELLDNRHIVKKSHVVNFPPGEQWKRSADQHRSVNFDFHSWNIIAPLLATLHEDGIVEAQRKQIEGLILDTVREWFELYSKFEKHTIDKDFAWYDMSVGLRASMLPHILKLGACSDSVSDEEFNKWVIVSVNHAKTLSLDSFHIEHNNHGLYQAFGHYVFCNHLFMIQRCDKDKELAKNRVKKYLNKYISKEGVHLEHSPGYQLYMVELLKQFHSHPDLVDLLDSDLVKKVEDSLAYFVYPNEKLAQLGDTDAKTVVLKKKRPHIPEITVFSDAGYGVVMSDSSHLIVSAAFHSRTHKHVDDGNFVWFDRGVPLIVDSGRYGYGRINLSRNERKRLREKGFWYSDPKRIYVESAHAHNTVEIDGRSDNRARSDYYGSGLKQGGKLSDGTFYFYLEVPRVEGGIKQQRAFVYNPGSWLFVIDKMVAYQIKERVYTSWFQLDSNAELISNEIDSSSFKVGEETLSIASFTENASIRIVKGSDRPRLEGWRSPRGGEFIPAWSLGIEVTSSDGAVIAGLLSIEGNPKVHELEDWYQVRMEDGSTVYEWLINDKRYSVRVCDDFTLGIDECMSN